MSSKNSQERTLSNVPLMRSLFPASLCALVISKPITTGKIIGSMRLKPIQREVVIATKSAHCVTFPIFGNRLCNFLRFSPQYGPERMDRILFTRHMQNEAHNVVPK